ncbi:MAG: non-heme iron oxygenase ferredoxin subunit [Dehalococcoidales bacterium]|jgi:3-phenylpropionate/trans-cinnamate dioxygenase ferredoxin subunit
MGKFVKVGVAGDFKDGTMKKVTVEGQDILVARAGGSYYAVTNRCSHMNGDLSKGTLEGTTVTCPLHGSQFDIRTGQNLRWLKGSGFAASIGKALKSPRGIAAYKVKVEGDAISVEV